MKIVGKTLDDVLRGVFTILLKASAISPTKGDCQEETGVLLEITSPRARLSRTETRGKPFSALGEFFWYMAGSNSLDFIQHYIDGYGKFSDDGETIHGGYGPRLFDQRGNNQLENVIKILTLKPESRRAVIQLFDAEDISRHYEDVPCTCTLQFLVRHRKLSLIVNMRSNDAFIGLPHDVFCFTMLQEIVSRRLGFDLGTYRHFAGSLHLYAANKAAAQQYLDEGIQSTILMPEMPPGDPWPSLRKVLEAEADIRNGQEPKAAIWALDHYWTDLVLLLQIFEARGDEAKIETLKAQMSFDKYFPYAENCKRMKKREARPHRPRQLPLF